jgi:Na+/alanine symporter
MVFTPMRIFTLGLAFNAVQANPIAAFLSDVHTVPTHLSGVVLALLAASVFRRLSGGGARRRVAAVRNGTRLYRSGAAPGPRYLLQSSSS